MGLTPGERLEYLRAHKIGDCQRCPLAKFRNTIVFGEGNPEARVMFVGEAPGAQEDATGRPFIGASGKLLTAWLESLGVQRSDVYIANTVKCLKGETLVRMADGTSQHIRDLVREKHVGPVLCVNPTTGELEPGEITGWHRNKLGEEQHWLRLSFDGARQCGPQGTARAIVTNDHQVLTRRGWVRTDALEAGDQIATGLPELSDSQYQIALGTLLGDAHGSVKSASLSLGHSVTQESWMVLKAASFGVDKISHSLNQGHATVRAHIPASFAMGRLRDAVYTMRNGKRRRQATRELISTLQPLGLAVWFLDDGYMRIREDGRQPRAEFGTYGFTRDDLDVLCSRLVEMGILVAIGSRGQLKLDVAQTRNLQQVIAPFVPPSMRWKLSAEFHSVPFQQAVYETPEQFVTTWATAAVERPTGRFFADRTTYCIDVKSHANFVTLGGVVHNCRPPENRDPFPQEKASCSPFLHAQIFLIRPRVLVALGRHAANTLTAQNLPMAGLRSSELVYSSPVADFRVPVIAAYHPSFVLRKGRASVEAQEAVADLRRAFAVAADAGA